jgi:hypothetical protein
MEFGKYLINSGKRVFIFCLVLLVPALVLVGINLLSSLHYMQLLTKSTLTKPEKVTTKSVSDSLRWQKKTPVTGLEFTDLIVAKEYWKNRLKLAKKDSIYLAVDLPDSLISIDIKGVPVRACKIQYYEMSPVLRYAKNKGVLTSWFNDSFMLQDYWATLPKAPLKVREAPADTNEAKEMVDANPPLEKQDVRFILQFNKNLILQIDQTEPFIFTGWFEKHFRNLQFRLEKGLEFIYTLSKLKWPEPELRIKINVSQSDAKAIFRALPQNAAAVIRL